jgi:hypothetical protein
LLLSLRDETNELALLRSHGQTQASGSVRREEERVSDRSYSERLRDHYQTMKYHDQQSEREDEEEVEEDSALALAEVLSKNNSQEKTR